MGIAERCRGSGLGTGSVRGLQLTWHYTGLWDAHPLIRRLLFALQTQLDSLLSAISPKLPSSSGAIRMASEYRSDYAPEMFKGRASRGLEDVPPGWVEVGFGSNKPS